MTQEEKRAIGWAVNTLRGLGCTAHEDDDTPLTWDVELADGSWEACNSIAELTACAKKVQAASQNPGVYRSKPL